MMNFEITVSPLKDVQGEVIAGIEVIRNIPERKRTEEKIRFMISHDIFTGLYIRYGRVLQATLTNGQKRGMIK